MVAELAYISGDVLIFLTAQVSSVAKASQFNFFKLKHLQKGTVFGLTAVLTRTPMGQCWECKD